MKIDKYLLIEDNTLSIDIQCNTFDIIKKQLRLIDKKLSINKTNTKGKCIVLIDKISNLDVFSKIREYLTSNGLTIGII